MQKWSWACYFWQEWQEGLQEARAQIHGRENSRGCCVVSMLPLTLPAAGKNTSPNAPLLSQGQSPAVFSVSLQKAEGDEMPQYGVKVRL